MKRSSRWPAVAVGAGCVAYAQVALAHPGHPAEARDALAAGALHPLLGPDHLLAAVAVGLLAVRIGGRRALAWLPATFVGLMLAGGTIAALGVPLPQAEWGITLSIAVLGLLVAMAPAFPLGVGAAVVGLFAFCHGHAHVAEVGGLSLLPYMTGLATGTLALHATGIVAGVWMVRAGRPWALRLTGAAIAAGVVVLLAAH